MAIAVDSTSSGVGSTGTTVTVSHTCTGTDLVLIVGVTGNDGSTPTAATYNGVAMTKSIDLQGTNADVVVFSLVGPDTGTHDIVVTKTNGTEIQVGAVSFAGAGGVDAEGTSGTNENGTSASVTTNTNKTVGYVVSALFWEQGSGVVTYTGAGTQFATVNGAVTSNTGRFTYQSFAAGANITESWTKSGGNTAWIAAGIEVYQVDGFTAKIMCF